MKRPKHNGSHAVRTRIVLSAALLLGALVPSHLSAFNVNVADRFGATVAAPYKWLLEEDNTHVAVPGTPVNDSISLVIHKSHAPNAKSGQSVANPDTITPPDPAKRYILSVMKEGYSVGGAIVDPGQTDVRVVLNKHKIPTAQISILAFNDNNPINNAPDATEQGLAGFRVVIDDAAAGGPMLTDAFGNPLGTTYKFYQEGDIIPEGEQVGDPIMVDDAPIVDTLGTGQIYTDSGGKALIKYLAPGKYGVRCIPPTGTDWTGGHGSAKVKGQWHQTATIEGTLTVDAWVKANEPMVFLEGFGPSFYHVFFGFVDPAKLPWDSNPPTSGMTVRGTNIFNHFGRPPQNQMFAPGPVVDQAWIGLNEMVGGLPGQGLYAAPVNADGTFEILNVPLGTYQLVTWDKPLDALFGFNTIVVTNSPNGVNDFGNVLSYRWFGTLDGSIFYDTDQDGFRDGINTTAGPTEEGIPNLAVNLRYRDGRIYQAQVTDAEGNYGFAEVFPFFKWLVTEVDFSRFKATGMTAVVDEGGFIPSLDWPAEGVRNPQPQYTTDPITGVANVSSPIFNPNTGDNLSRTETGPVLTEAMHLFLNQNNRIDWGKINYTGDENGGISGVIGYQTTRAEENPRDAVIDGWEPGVPRVQVALYLDANADKVIDSINGVAGIQIADVDNYPLGWATGGAKGPEDIDQDPLDGPSFNPGDAVNIVWSDSWDEEIDASPTLGAIQTSPPFVLKKPIIGADNYGTWNQIRPGIFDGGYAFGDYHPAGMPATLFDADPLNDPPASSMPPGMYIVQAVPPPDYLVQTEESQNVIFGDAYKPSKLWLPPECVGTRENHGGANYDDFVSGFVPSTRADPYTVADLLSLFPEANEPAPFAGQERPLADMKWVRVSAAQNAAADFHVYTEVPKAARAVGFVLNDFTAEFNAFSPIFGEKGSPGWLPISFRDWAGTEVVRVYSDEYGTYNAMLPSTYTVNVPSPSGVSPNMLTLVLNDPTMPNPLAGQVGQPDRIPDPYYNPNFSTTPWTFMYYPGSVSYLDTPIVPIGGLVGFPNNQLDTEPPTGTPAIKSVTGTSVGPYVANIGDIITITSMGTKAVVPDPTSLGYGTSSTITRDYSFGAAAGGNGKVTISGGGLLAPRNLTILSWNADRITARLPVGTSTGEYQLMVTRNGGATAPATTSRSGVTLTFGGAGTPHYVTPVAPSEADPMPTPIQDAIDAAQPGDLILVGEGNYHENPVMHKPVRLQGSGVGTVILANPNPMDRVAEWHNYVKENLGLGVDQSDAFIANEMPGILAYSTDPGAFKAENAASHIDGFQIIGSIAGGGIALYNNVHNLRISNNRITGNQGTYGGGISVGVQGQAGLLFDNTNVTIERNQVLKNGGRDGAGGIAVFTGATGYKILNNDIIGNFCRGNGGGISHEGLSPNGLIAGNRIAFNEIFYGLLVGGDGGGIYIAGTTPAPGALSTGAGSVTILNNLIQGNLAGSGHGGGIRVVGFNGADLVAPTPPGGTLPEADWYALDIINNMIVNNVAGWAGAGISLQDVTRGRIIHNTITRNDSTATSRSAFDAGAINSNPQVAGLAVHMHNLLLATYVPPDQVYANPLVQNNILLENRSFYFDGTTQSLVPRGAGVNAFWDVGVVELPGSLVNVQNSLLRVAHGPGPGNIVTTQPRLSRPYNNPLHTAVVIDEAGNNISVRLEQMVGAGGIAAGADYGDYHINNNSPARNTAVAVMIPPVAYDFDGQGRPAETNPDMGADERNATATTVELAATAPAVGPPASGTAPPWDAPATGAGTSPGTPEPIAFELPPADMDDVDTDGDGITNNDHAYANLTGGDGFAKMADGNELYQFSFSDVTQLTWDTYSIIPNGPKMVQPAIMNEGKLKAEIPAPIITLREGQKFYLDLSNVGMIMRPDLFDPHSVHFHGFPQAASIFDGEPFASIVINVGATLRYFYDIVEPGTYIYHCHVEATEHMEMGMLGPLNVEPKQNFAHIGPDGESVPVLPTFSKLPAGKGPTHQPGYKYAYNDGDGSTYYDNDYSLQFAAFDRNFHEQHILVQPLPFSDLEESYPMINGRGYPDTVNTGHITNTKVQEVLGLNAEYPSQKQNALITATTGQKVLLRLSNVSISDFHTITVLGIPMRVIAKDAKLLRGPTGLDLSYESTSFTFGGGETADVILDTTGVTPGTYFLYDSRLNHLCNDQEDFGGMMTEIIINAAP